MILKVIFVRVAEVSPLTTQIPSESADGIVSEYSPGKVGKRTEGEIKSLHRIVAHRVFNGQELAVCGSDGGGVTDQLQIVRYVVEEGAGQHNIVPVGASFY